MPFEKNSNLEFNSNTLTVRKYYSPLPRNFQGIVRNHQYNKILKILKRDTEMITRSPYPRLIQTCFECYTPMPETGITEWQPNLIMPLPAQTPPVFPWTVLHLYKKLRK
jgi:hypothetical protein